MRARPSEPTWSEIGKNLGISGEQARIDFLSAREKIRRRFPDLIEILGSSLRVKDHRSTAQQVIDQGPHETGLSFCDWDRA